MENLCYCLFSIFIIQAYGDCIEEHPLHGQATISTGHYHSIHYECDEGYELFGAPDSYCFGGVWATPTPVCHAKGCIMDGYNDVVNGEIDIISEGSLLIVTCQPGFIMDGESTISCDGEKWSEPLPNCYSAVAIDHCNFEHQSFCGWTQDSEDHPDWEINSRETDTKRTGPTFDHTFGPDLKSGHYIYMESSIPRQYGHTSRLISPVYPRSKSRRCFQLWYHMLGPEEPEYMGDLEVFLRLQSGLNHIEIELFSVRGNQGDEWHKAEMFIQLQDSDFQIVVQATKGRSHISDIAVDDFSFYKCTNDTDIISDLSTESSFTIANNLTAEENDTTSETFETVLNDTTVLDVRETDSMKKHSNAKSGLDISHESKSGDTSTTERVPGTSTNKRLPGTFTTELVPSTIETSTVETFTFHTSSDFQIVMETEEPTDFFPWSHPATEDIHIVTENVIVYPVDTGHLSENMETYKRSDDNNNLEKSVGTTATSKQLRSEVGESILFKPEFIAIIVGLCSVVVLSVVVVSVIVHRRRHIWRRKTSDDQFQVLYTKNLQLTEASQNV